MIRCKQAIEAAGVEGYCGKTTMCCRQCEEYASCKLRCEDDPAECGAALEEETALALFQEEKMAVIKAMADILTQKKAFEEKEKDIRAALIREMDAYGVKSFENDFLKVTYVAPTTKTSIDSKALKKDMPDVAEKYSKTSTVSASVRISLKGDK